MRPLIWQKISVSTNKLSHFFAEHAWHSPNRGGNAVWIVGHIIVTRLDRTTEGLGLLGLDVLACIFPVLEGRISRYPLDHLLELGRPEVTERYIGQMLRQGRRGLLGMALLEARLFYIILVVGAFLSLDLDGSRSRSVLTGWHLVLSWLVLTLPPRAVPLFVFCVEQIGDGCQPSSVPEDTTV